MTGIQREKLCDGVFFSSIREERFKTGRISATLLLPLRAETAAANSILPYLLRRSCREYPDFTAFNRKLSELYGATLYGDVRKIGEMQALTVGAVGLDDRYALNGEWISTELSGLLCKVLFDPAMENGLFREEDVEQERRQLLDQIDSEFNDKRTYARLRCEELMCKGEAFGVSRYGTRAQVESLTAQEITEAWKNALANARIELMMIGSSDPKAACACFEEALTKIERHPVADTSTEVIRSVKKVRTYNDSMEVAQCKLVMGFRAGTAVPQEEVMAARLMAALFGGTPHSKLFLNVREKLSLCYYCSARYDRQKGIVLVESGVEQKNIEKARDEILRQLEELQKGNFDESEIQAAKRSLANSFVSACDYLGGLESWYLSQALEGTLHTPQESAAEIGEITREQIVETAQRVALDTIYTLTGKEAEV